MGRLRKKRGVFESARRILGFEALLPDVLQQFLRLVRPQGVAPRREHRDDLQHVFRHFLL